MQASSRRTFWLRLVGTLLAFGLLGVVLRQQGWDEIWPALAQMDAGRLTLGVALMVVSRLAVVGRWHALMRSGGAKLPWGQAARITWAGLFANNFLPTTVGGDAVRLAGALRYGYDPAVATAALIADRLVGMAGMALTLPFGLPRLLAAPAATSLSQPVFENNGTTDEHRWTQMLREKPDLLSLNIRVGLCSSVVPVFSSGWVSKLWQKGDGLLRRLLETLGLWLRRPGGLLAALGWTLLNQACLFGFLWVMLDGMGQKVPFWLVAGLYSIVYFITLTPVSINGYGVQELSMALIFTRLGGASAASGAVLAILFRTVMMLTSLPGAVFVPGMVAGKAKAAE